MLLYGAGEHAKIVKEILESQGTQVIGIFDDAQIGNFFEGIPHFLEYQATFQAEESLIISIGDNFLRHTISKKIKHQFGKAFHQQSWISPSAEVAEGTVLGAQACLQAQAKVGKHSILNTAVIVEHDVQIGDFVHLAPASVVGARAKIGAFTLVGMNATILPSVEVGKNCLIGAGSVVTQSVAEGSVVWGNPARFIRKHSF